MQRYQAPGVPPPAYGSYYPPQYGNDPRSYAAYAYGYPTPNKMQPPAQVRAPVPQMPVPTQSHHHLMHTGDHSHHHNDHGHAHHSQHHTNHHGHAHRSPHHRHHHDHHRHNDESDSSERRRYRYVRNNYCQTSPLAFLNMAHPDDGEKKSRSTPEFLKDEEAEKLKRLTPEFLRDDLSPALIVECATPDGFKEGSATARDPKKKPTKANEPPVPGQYIPPPLPAYGYPPVMNGNPGGYPPGMYNNPTGYPPGIYNNPNGMFPNNLPATVLSNKPPDRRATPAVKKK